MKRVKLLLLLIGISIQGYGQCWQTVSAGNGFIHTIKTDGTLWAFGGNTDGRLGDGTTVNRNVSTSIAGNSTWTAVSGGNFFTAAIRSNGTLWTWGNSFGGPNPIQVGTDTDWQSVSAGAFHILILKTDGTLWAFGQNNKGQLGINSTVDNYIPTQIGTATNWQLISAGGYHSSAIKTDGTLWTWGDNTSGQLGDAGMTNYRTVPYQVGTETNWLSTSCGGGGASVIAMKTNHSIWSWGNNAFGALGIGNTTNKNVPQQIGTSTDWKSIQMGYYHTMAIKNDGTLWGCGYNSTGQLGDGTLANKLNMVQIGTETNWQEVYCGGNHSIGKKTNGALFTWGKNQQGQLGDATFVDKNTPIQISVCSNLNVPVFDARSVYIYPNPVTEILKINNSGNEELEDIVILNLMGQNLFEINKNTVQINVNGLEAGIYFLKYRAAGKEYSQKFIKK